MSIYTYTYTNCFSSSCSYVTSVMVDLYFMFFLSDFTCTMVTNVNGRCYLWCWGCLHIRYFNVINVGLNFHLQCYLQTDLDHQKCVARFPIFEGRVVLNGKLLIKIIFFPKLQSRYILLSMICVLYPYFQIFFKLFMHYVCEGVSLFYVFVF